MASEVQLPSLSRELLSDKAYAAIRASIVDGSFAPGEQIVESQVARQMQISQAPVRDALRKLSHEGLVTVVPRRGTFVTEISNEEAADARVVRQALESLAARLIAGHLDSDFAKRLRGIVNEMRKAARKHDIAAFRIHDADFHRTIIEASGNVMLPKVWFLLEQSMYSLQVVSSPRNTDEYEAIAEVHESLIEVLEAGDPDVAAQAFVDHSSRLSLEALQASTHRR